MRDGFIDRYSGERLIFLGVLTATELVKIVIWIENYLCSLHGGFFCCRFTIARRFDIITTKIR